MSEPLLVTEPPLPPRARRHVLIPFAIVTLIWGSTWIVIRYQIGGGPAGWSVSLRFAIATVAMFAYARVAGIPLALPRRAWPAAGIVGLCQFVLNFHFVYRAEAHVTSGVVAMIYALLVVPNAIFGRIFLGHGISRPFLAGSAVALVGVGLLFDHELKAVTGDSAATALGIALTLCGVLCASAANIAQATKGAAGLSVVAMLAWAMLFGTGIDVVVAFLTEGPPVFALSWSFFACAAYLGILGSAVSFPLYFTVIREIGPARAAYSSVLIPVIAMAISTVLEGYVWSLESIAGGVLVLAGLVVALRSRSPAR